MRLILLLLIALLLYGCPTKNERPEQAIAPLSVPALPTSTIEIPVAIPSQEIENLLLENLPNPVLKGKTAPWKLELKGKEKKETAPSFWQKITAPVVSWVDKNFSVNAHLVYEVNMHDLNINFEGENIIAAARLEIKSDLMIDRAIPFSDTRKSNHIPCPLAAQLTLTGQIEILEEYAQLAIHLDENKGQVQFDKVCSNQSLAGLNIPNMLKPLLTPLTKEIETQISRVVTQQIQRAITQNEKQLTFGEQVQQLAKVLDKPYELDKNIWLLPQIKEVFISQFEGETINGQNQLTFSVGTLAKPIVKIGNKPKQENTGKVKISNRKVYNKSSIHIQGGIGLDTAAQQLQMYLKDYVDHSYSKYGYTIGAVEIYPHYRKAVVAVELLKAKNNKHKAIIYLAGIPKYDLEQKEIYLDSLQLMTKTKNIVLQSAKWLLQPKVMKQLASNTRFAIADQLATIQNQLNDFELKEKLGILSGRFDVVDLEAVFISQAAFEVILKVEGQLHFEWQK